MIDAANESNRRKVRDILGAFLFRGDDVDKYVRVLSGGERNRLALAKMLLQPFNVLIMDEPTNHLDIQSKNILKKALFNYQGTLILVSHDRSFLQGLTNKIYEFKDHKLKEYLGDIDYFLEQRNIQNMREAEKRSVQKISKQSTPSSNKKSYEDQKRLKSLKSKLSKLESSISALEKERKEIDLELSINYEKTIAKDNFFDLYHEKKEHLDSMMKDWESLTQQIEEIE
jgi:ATP-binding cassette subfamily F protein 3